MKIVQVNKYSDFLALKGTWQDILQRCNSHTIFSTWEWLSTWWKHFGNDKKLLVLLVKENKEVIGIAPLMYSVHKMFGLRMGKIEFIGTPHADYNDILLTEKSEECLKLLTDYLWELPDNWKRSDLAGIPQNSRSLPFLGKLSWKSISVLKCPYIPLPRSYEAFLVSNLKRNQRKYVYRNMRNLERDFKVEIVDCSDVQSSTEGMHRLFELHQKRWESRGYSGAFAEEKFRNFHLDIAKSFSQKKWLGLHLLNASGVTVSANYGFKYQSRFYSYLTGFDPRYTKYGVGNLLHAYSIQRFIDEGLTEYDFMRGAEEYKARWNTLARLNSRAVLIRKGVAASIEYRLYEEYWNQGNWLKYFLGIPCERVSSLFARLNARAETEKKNETQIADHTKRRGSF